jgi:PAS domain S-box-containing protein
MEQQQSGNGRDMSSVIDVSFDSERFRDPRRLAAIRRTLLLDAPYVPELDRLSRLASRIVGAPVSLVSLIDADRQYFAGASGLPRDVHDAQQTPLSHSLCRLVVDAAAPVVIDDATSDARSRENGSVVEMEVGAYAGVPLTAPDGELLGAFCAIDWKPRIWTQDELDSLADIAGAVASEIESQALLNELHREQRRLRIVASIGAAMASTVDHRELASIVASQVAPTLCDWCLVELDDDPAAIHPAAHHALGVADESLREDVERMRSLARRQPGWRSPGLDAARDARAIHVERVSIERMIDEAQLPMIDPELVELVEVTGMNTISAAPLMSAGGPVGSISFVRRAGEFDADERALHRAIARQLATAIEASRAIEQLRVQARAAQAIEHIGDGVVLLDEHSTVVLWNPAIERITGIVEELALGTPLALLVPTFADAVDAATGGSRQLVALHSTGGSRWLAVTSDPVGSGIVMAIRDVTAELELERARDEMLATVSHQLRTPVTSVLGAALTLQRSDIELEEDTRDELLHTITQQARRLGDLCDDVLLAYRLDNDGHKLRGSMVALDVLLDEMRDGIAVDGHGTQLQIGAGVHDAVAFGDEHALRQVFGNLIDNARKYSPDGSPIEVDAYREGESVVVTVRDHGIGIPLEHHDAIFDRFHRLDPNMSYGVGGAGLGLFVVRELVTLMDGCVEVAASDAEGTTMAVRLNATPPSPID